MRGTTGKRSESSAHPSGWRSRQWSRTYGSVSREKVRSTEDRRGAAGHRRGGRRSRRGERGGRLPGGHDAAGRLGGLLEGDAELGQDGVAAGLDQLGLDGGAVGAGDLGAVSGAVFWAAVFWALIWGAEPLRRTRGVPRSRRTVVRDGAALAVAGGRRCRQPVPPDVAALGPQGGRHPAQLGHPRPVGHVGRHRQVALVLQGVVDEAGQAPGADLHEGPHALRVQAAGEGTEAHRLQQVADDEVAHGGGVVGEGADGGGRPHRHRRAGGSGGGRTTPAPGRGRGRASASGSRT